MAKIAHTEGTDHLPLLKERSFFSPRADESFWGSLSFRLYDLLVLEWCDVKGCIHPVKRQTLRKKKIVVDNNLLMHYLGYWLQPS